MAANRRRDQPSRAELLAELARLRDSNREAELTRVLHELQVHHEESLVQQSQLIESQRALEEARDRFAELFDFSPVAYVVLEATGVISEANLATAHLFGRERARILGTPLFLYVTQDDRLAVLDHLARARSSRVRVETAVQFAPRDGATIPALMMSAPAAVGHDRPPVVLTAIVDLTERQRLENEREKARAEQERLAREERIARAGSEAKDRFIAALSHELRTPLTPILFAVDAVENRAALPESVRQTLDLIRRNVLLETRLIDDLLDLTRIVQGKLSLTPEVVNVHELIADVVALCREELRAAQVQLGVETRARTFHVSGDPLRLRQVVWNLLRNAVRNTPAGGRIVVQSANPAPGWVEVVVQDSGRGIDAAMLTRIFMPFEQGEEARRHGVGLGLGLPISKGIVEAHGGRIEAASAGLGRGARFAIELRTVKESSHVGSPRGAEKARTARVRTVLLVEDNADSANAIAELLRVHGYDVKVADSVEQALQFADQADVVVSDIALPDGTGHDLMQQIRARRPIRGIALSGYGSHDDMRRSSDAGFERHLVKPVDPQLLLDAIENEPS